MNHFFLRRLAASAGGWAEAAQPPRHCHPAAPSPSSLAAQPPAAQPLRLAWSSSCFFKHQSYVFEAGQILNFNSALQTVRDNSQRTTKTKMMGSIQRIRWYTSRPPLENCRNSAMVSLGISLGSYRGSRSSLHRISLFSYTPCSGDVRF